MKTKARPRRYKSHDAMLRVTVRLSRKLLWHLDQQQKQLGVSRSVLIRTALSDWARAHRK